MSDIKKNFKNERIKLYREAHKDKMKLYQKSYRAAHRKIKSNLDKIIVCNDVLDKNDIQHKISSEILNWIQNNASVHQHEAFLIKIF